MGKSELSKMDPFQMVILFMIAELASIPIESPAISLLSGATAIFTLLLLQVLISLVSLKIPSLKIIFNGKPSILIKNGVLDEKELKAQRVTIDDLTEQLRIKNAPSIADVEFAILEANGDLSVILKPGKRPLTPDDLNITKPQEIIPMVIISDGRLYSKNLSTVGYDENYLKGELLKAGITHYEQVFLCLCDESKKLHIYESKKFLNEKSIHIPSNEEVSK